MKLNIEITDLQTTNQIPHYWSADDYKNLLKDFDFQEADEVPAAEVLEYLNLAITEFDPADAAEIILKYKLSDDLNEGQIQNISHEMMLDKVAEEYPLPELHYALFNVNQLLYQAYNGKFPNTEATIIRMKLTGFEHFELTKEIALKAIVAGLKENNLVSRLFSEQISGEEKFDDAQKVIWEMTQEADEVQIITSDYWISNEDFAASSYEAQINFFEEE